MYSNQKAHQKNVIHMDPYEIIKEYYSESSSLYKCLILHSEKVAQKALSCAKNVDVDQTFIREAALMHDIGIYLTYAPKISCYGNLPYIFHGYLGMRLLEQKGLYRHAQVCVRHVGVGLTIEEIEERNLPLPKMDMQPETLEEQIICYADKFFSKSENNVEKTIDQILWELSHYNEKSIEKFMKWHQCFGVSVSKSKAP
jgi:uncharacterized protein